MRDPAGLILEMHAVAEPVLIVGLGIVDPEMVKAPTALGAVERGGGGEIGAVEDRLQFERPHQFMRIAGDELIEVGADFAEPFAARSRSWS